MQRIVLKGGTVVTSEDQREADVVIEGGKIVEVVENYEGDAEVVDCAGMHVMPGAIDVHVHFRTPGSEQKEDWTTGSRAAAKGGVTTVLDMPNTSPAVVTEEVLDQKRQIVAADSLVNYGFNFGASVSNFEEIKAVFGKKGVAAVKVYMGASTGDLLMDDLEVLEKLLAAGIFVLVHAECNCMMEENKKKFAGETDPAVHSKIRDPQVAFKAMKDAVDLAVKTGGRLHVCHMSTKLEVDYLKKIRAELGERALDEKGVRKITCEVCPHHLCFDTSDYEKYGTYVQMNPSLHEQEDVKALWEGLKDGTVDVVATDHAPHLREEKDLGYGRAPSGVPGVETVVPFLLDAVAEGQLKVEDVARLMGSAPAEIFRLKGKGKLESGMDADVMVVDLGLEKEVKNEEQETKCGWSPFDGRVFKGLPVMTFVCGEKVFERGEFHQDVRGKEIEVE